MEGVVTACLKVWVYEGHYQRSHEVGLSWQAKSVSMQVNVFRDSLRALI